MLSDPLVQSLLLDIVEDEENLKIIQCLINDINTDEEIAEKTEIRLNIVRKILYKLYDSGLASYKRSKDPETQWYTYAWKFEEEEVSKQLEEKATSLVSNLERMLHNEENSMFFVCPYGHCRFDFDNASLRGFICPDCGAEVKFEDNSQKIEKIKEKIDSCKETYAEALSESGK